MALPLLLLLPGMTNNAELWQYVAPGLAEVAEVRIAEFPTQDSVAAMADAALDLAGARDFSLAGFSLGGWVAQDILSRAPERVERLALIDSAAGPISPEMQALMEKSRAAAARHYDVMLERMLPGAVHPSRLADPALCGAAIAMFRNVGAEAFARHCTAAIGRPDHRDALQEFTRPALIVCGRQDRVTPPEQTEELARLLPGAGVEWIDECGHLSPLERPAAVVSALRRWMSRN